MIKKISKLKLTCSGHCLMQFDAIWRWSKEEKRHPVKLISDNKSSFSFLKFFAVFYGEGWKSGEIIFCLSVFWFNRIQLQIKVKFFVRYYFLPFEHIQAHNLITWAKKNKKMRRTQILFSGCLCKKSLNDLNCFKTRSAVA